MSETNGLPKGWTLAKIGDLIDCGGVFCDGDWVESEDQDPNGDVRLVQLADIGDGHFVNKSRRFLTSDKAAILRCTFLEAGDVLIARMPDPLGRACIFPGDTRRAVTVVDVCIVRTGTDEIDHRWLVWFVNSPQFRLRVASLQSGSTRARISRGNLATITLPVPPTAEQRRIVAKIEELFSDLDAGVAALERVRANLKRYRAAVLKAAVEGRLTEKWRQDHPPAEPASKLLERILIERRHKWEQDQLAKYAAEGKAPPKSWRHKYEEPIRPDVSNLPALPPSWCWVTFDQCAEDVTVGHVGPMKDQYIEQGIPFLRSQNVRPLRFDPEGLKFIPKVFHDSLRKSKLFGGELLVVRSGNVGDSCVYPHDEGEANCADLVVTRLVTNLLAQYACIYIASPGGIASVAGKQSGSALTHFNVGAMRRSAIPLPPTSEQAQIVTEVERRLSVADAVDAQLKLELKRSPRLRQSILKHAFDGKLVTQNAHDEPAAVLVKGISSKMSQSRTAGRKRVAEKA